MNDSFTRSPKVILDHFKVDPSRGLSPAQVSAGLDKYGKNGMLLLDVHTRSNIASKTRKQPFTHQCIAIFLSIHLSSHSLTLYLSFALLDVHTLAQQNTIQPPYKTDRDIIS